MPDGAFDQIGNVIAVERYFCWRFRLHCTIGRIARQTDLRQLGVIIARHNTISGFRLCPRFQVGAVTTFHLHQITRLSANTQSSPRDSPNSSQKISVLCSPISGARREIRQGEPL